MTAEDANHTSAVPRANRPAAVRLGQPRIDLPGVPPAEDD